MTLPSHREPGRLAEPAEQDLDFRFGGFDNLIPHRVDHVLLVSSLYESFILEEDGLVAELITSEYVDMKLSNPPRVSRVSSPSDALDFVRHERIDLVITMTRLGDWNVGDFAVAVHDLKPELPVVVLASDTRELTRHAESSVRDHCHRFFVWNGDSKILLAIIKLIEDEMNVEHDTLVGDVRIIILIENSVRFYSQYLPLIYTELVKQTQSLMEEGINRMHRLLRMRARPKILLAETYEEAWGLYSKFSNNILGIISDIRFPREGQLDADAGLLFARRIIEENPDNIPILLQSSDAGQSRRARRLGVGFLNKRSRSLLQDLRGFIQGSMGFGDFIFTYPNGNVVGRATDLRSFEQMVRKIPNDCLKYHAHHNHFSNWLMARTEFDLASRIRPVKISDFPNLTDMREYLLQQLAGQRESSQTGIITDFSARTFDGTSAFTRIGGGSMGGKARGLAFMSALLHKHCLYERFENVRVNVPTSAALGTDVFDTFMDKNKLHKLVAGDPSDEEITAAFLKAKIPRNAHRKLTAFTELVKYPLAVRSSGLLEDSQEESFAGVYTTHMLPNNHQDPAVRLEQVCNAIKLVYASVFYGETRAYLDATAHHIEGEKMGVLLQEIVGSRHGERFYPTFSGTARSYNFYPAHRMNPEDGVAQVALGLGKFVVEGGRSLMFSPAHPKILPQFASTKAMFNNSQRTFFALEINHPDVYPTADSNANLIRLDLDVAEQDGTLAPIGSVYSAENDMVYDSLSHAGPRLVTFAHVLKSNLMPLAEILKTLLTIGSEAMGGPIEIEFAVDMSRKPVRFGFLQIRPSVGADDHSTTTDVSPQEREQAVCWSPEAMGNGRIEDVRDIVYVKPEAFDKLQTRVIAAEIGQVNDSLRRDGRSCLLIGPGRWGSSDRFLGIPVNWSQITAARVIVETTLNNFMITPSQGTHFFQNLATFRVAYLTVNPTTGDGAVDYAWLSKQPKALETQYLRHVRLAAPLQIKTDGRTRRSVILPPTT